MEGLIVLVVVVIVGGLYFLPTIIGFLRNKRNKMAILALNFFLGWSLVGVGHFHGVGLDS